MLIGQWESYIHPGSRASSPGAADTQGEPTRRRGRGLTLRSGPPHGLLGGGCLEKAAFLGHVLWGSQCCFHTFIRVEKLPHLGNTFKGIRFSSHMGTFSKRTCPGFTSGLRRRFARAENARQVIPMAPKVRPLTSRDLPRSWPDNRAPQTILPGISHTALQQRAH